MALIYIGNCRTGLENGDLENYFSDATQMAQLVENSRIIDKKQFIQLGGIPKRNATLFGIYGAIVWQYVDRSDIHYFYMLEV